MQISLVALLTILGMGAVTYATRIGGFWLLGRVTPTKRVEAWMRAIPGAVLVSLIAPALLASGVVGFVGWRRHRANRRAHPSTASGHGGGRRHRRGGAAAIPHRVMGNNAPFDPNGIFDLDNVLAGDPEQGRTDAPRCQWSACYWSIVALPSLAAIWPISSGATWRSMHRPCAV